MDQVATLDEDKVEIAEDASSDIPGQEIGVEDSALGPTVHSPVLAADPMSDSTDDEDLTVPYEASDEDDDDDFSRCHDAEFLESGWCAQCLHDTEDIDFEFVYALHTFVATVEGQANATKGDTMVLLDDSNSYWWLVRVVKDSSIGELLCSSRDKWGI
jgi:hypothetical protein